MTEYSPPFTNVTCPTGIAAECPLAMLCFPNKLCGCDPFFAWTGTNCAHFSPATKLAIFLICTRIVAGAICSVWVGHMFYVLHVTSQLKRTSGLTLASLLVAFLFYFVWSATSLDNALRPLDYRETPNLPAEKSGHLFIAIYSMASAGASIASVLHISLTFVSIVRRSKILSLDNKKWHIEFGILFVEFILLILIISAIFLKAIDVWGCVMAALILSMAFAMRYGSNELSKLLTGGRAIDVGAEKTGPRARVVAEIRTTSNRIVFGLILMSGVLAYWGFTIKAKRQYRNEGANGDFGGRPDYWATEAISYLLLYIDVSVGLYLSNLVRRARVNAAAESATGNSTTAAAASA